ncbi:MAG: hypothetical protein K0R18_242 [Bacillales bacterium]|jgi:hypothetical protein|nr:hypothetical protein [Bacillales bacterium]
MKLIDYYVILGGFSMTLKITNNMFDATLRVFSRLYPDKTNLIIQFDPLIKNKKKTGYLLLPEPDGEITDIFVFINAKLSVMEAVDALIEQLTEVVVGVDKEHNEFVWRKTYNELMDLSEKELLVMFDELNLDKTSFYQFDDTGKEIERDDKDE